MHLPQIFIPWLLVKITTVLSAWISCLNQWLALAVTNSVGTVTDNGYRVPGRIQAALFAGSRSLCLFLVSHKIWKTAPNPLRAVSNLVLLL